MHRLLHCQLLAYSKCLLAVWVTQSTLLIYMYAKCTLQVE